MIVTLIASLAFAGLFFLGERIFTRKRTMNDYAIIWFLIFSGMLISSAWAKEPSVDDFWDYKLDRQFVVAKCLDEFSADKQASKYKFPPKKFDRATMNEDYTLSEYGKDLVRKCNAEESRLELQRHLALRDIWVDRLNACTLIPEHPDQEQAAKMLASAALVGLGSFPRTVWAIFIEFAGYYSHQTISSYYDMEACAKFITWHDSCFQSFLNHCANNHY
ncbi:MAG: hypothetical protein KDK62_04595 [Chlamydiia bacterium]|nr:hypothetical protein [Chlamydiia bacterium]